MPKHFWFKFEWEKWRNDRELRRCSKETKGFWIDCIALMEKEEVYFLEGTPEELCRDIVSTRDEFDKSIKELIRTNAATISKSQGRVKIVSRKILKAVNLTEYNRLKQAERRSQLNVKAVSKPPSKDIEVLESSSYEEEKNKNTHINAGARESGAPPGEEAIKWTWPMAPLIAVFAEYLDGRVTPAMIGFIEADVKPGDELAWSQTIALYRMNFNVATKSYLPDKIGNLIETFRNKKAELERKQNGNSKKSNTGRGHSKADTQSTDEYLASIGANPSR